MPRYRFLTRQPGRLDGDLIEGDFPNDDAAITDARIALADLVHDDVLEQKKTLDEIEVLNERGTVIATVTLLDH